jgi:hypothetical protein
MITSLDPSRPRRAAYSKRRQQGFDASADRAKESHQKTTPGILALA